jgi:hypothetical protein
MEDPIQDWVVPLVWVSGEGGTSRQADMTGQTTFHISLEVESNSETGVPQSHSENVPQ